MPRYPVIKRIIEGLHVDMGIAKKIHQLMKSAYGYHGIDDALEEINKLIGGYGVEAIEGRDYVDGYYQHFQILYVNLGDSYVPTVTYDTVNEEFVITSWGDIVESEPEQFDPDYPYEEKEG